MSDADAAWPVRLALSTHWNAHRHAEGEALIAEALALGFDTVELGYDLHVGLVPGVKSMVDGGTVRVSSVHNFCPVPIGVSRGHPELFALCARDAAERGRAVTHTERTIRFAAEVGAKVVVAHAGNVDMRRYTFRMIELAEKGGMNTPRFDRLRLKSQIKRDRKAGRHLEALRRTLHDLLPVLETTGVALALENLPTWEAVPTEMEMESLLAEFDSPLLRYWHDVGHGQIRHNLGFVSHLHWLARLAPRLAGLHLHDVAPPARDHLMPPAGGFNFRSLRPFVARDTLLVLEPAPGLPAEDVVAGKRAIEEALRGDERNTE